MTAGIIRAGISGWTYESWRGCFYPKGLRRDLELAYAARQFRSIELNTTFYAMQRPSEFAAWMEQVPGEFIFAVKGPRCITHILRLRNVETPLANFFASGPLLLGTHLGPIVWQLPANLRFEAARMEAFLALLPADTESAAALGRKYDHRLRAPPWLAVDARRPLRHAIEVRHDSFNCEEFVDLLRRHNVALVCADSVEWPRLMDVTADFVYVRLHGSEELYASGYDNQALDNWARRAKAWAAGDEPDDAMRAGGPARRRKRDVFVYFDNDRKVRAPANARELMRRLKA